MILYAVTIFVSAFLLFLVQPLLGKYILPWFGGSAAVWTTCLLFFQVLLLGGYGYAHLLHSRLTVRKQASVHLFLLALTVSLLPITPAERWKAAGLVDPTWHILGLLFASIGACYFLLSSTAPLLQSWFGRVRPELSPYPLYALSNLGSLIAIGSYPFLVEPVLGLRLQSRFWSCCYVVFALLCGICAVELWRKRPIEDLVMTHRAGQLNGSDKFRTNATDRVMWLSLAALSSTMLLATTNQLCLDAAVVPLLWLLPMSLYLLSFILCFHSNRWYSRLWYGIALSVGLAQTCVVLRMGVFLGLKLQIASYSFTLFVCCMVCNGELVRLKPGRHHLTSFYLIIAAGGALGGAFVSLIAPHFFKGYWEFHLGVAGTALLFLIILFRDKTGRLCCGRPSWAWSLIYLSYIALLLALGLQIRDSLQDTITVKRNFFGVLKVAEDERNAPDRHRTVLMNGRIEHGYQFVSQEKRYWPTSYFGPNSGIGIAIRFHPRRLKGETRNLRIGVVGLGTGTIASYGRTGDYIRFYEINPDVIDFSDTYFSYRKDSSARVESVLGDARISMENERVLRRSAQYDVLAVDAFSSDAIPVHLLTRECYRIYCYHLKKDGILAVHISSRYFDLSPVVRNLAELDFEGGMQAILVEDKGDIAEETDPTSWVLVTSNEEFLSNKQVQRVIKPWTSHDSLRLLFTDDYSNLFRLLK